MTGRWDRQQSLFHEALELADEDRDAFLDQACAGDAALRAELDALLGADPGRAERIVPAAIGSAGDADPADTADRQLEGEQLGAYRLLRHIGAGGMGSVFLAERSDGTFERQVALKVVKKGMDSEAVVRRFEMERQILARLEHPNIAGLLDGGMTPDGRPYFVMEHVDGMAITEYCDEHRLDVRARLALFQVVCVAVHHAHQSLVVHRDLKPTNILVTSDGEVKLLDFGIAKLLDDSAADPVMTQTGALLLTPAYAAPEQLLGERVTTVTDVYALGVLLFELLTGRRPFEVTANPFELRDAVMSQDPTRPSTAVATPTTDRDGKPDPAALEAISRARGAPVDRLRSLLRGDLDRICLMALRREPELRYLSADQFATDIRRHLDGLPVIAQPDTLAYRLTKFVRRHTVGVAGTAAALIAFVVLTGFYTSRLSAERDRAIEEQQKTREVVEFVTGLFKVADPTESRGEEVTARELLDAGARRIDFALGDRPTLQATMKSVLGNVYYQLGAGERARELLQASLEFQKAQYGDVSLEVASTQHVLGMVHQYLGDNETAGTFYERTYETRRALLGDTHPDVVEALSTHAFLVETIGDYDAAERLHLQAFELARDAASGRDDAHLALAMARLAGIYRIQDRSPEAEPLLRDALAMQNRVYGGPHPESDETRRQLAGLLRVDRRFEESKALYIALIESRERMLGPDHNELASTWNSYSQLLSDMGDLPGAIFANRQLIDITTRVHGDAHQSLGAAYNNLAILYRKQGELDNALHYFQRSLDMQDAVGLPPRHPNRSFPSAGMAIVLMLRHEYAESEAMLRDALRLRREAFPEAHRLISELKSHLAAALIGQQQWPEAETLLLDAWLRFSTEPRDRRSTLAPRGGAAGAAVPAVGPT